MSRLYYDYDPQIRNLADESSSASKEYVEKVAKLIPGEVIALYIGLVGFVPSAQGPISDHWLYGLSFAICLALTPLYLGQMADPKRPKTRHIVVSMCAFVIWAYAISGGVAIPSYYKPGLAGMLTLIFTGISGKIPLGLPKTSSDRRTGLKNTSILF